MADFKILTHETIDIFAKRHYDNRGASIEEFEVVRDLMKEMIGNEFDDNGNKRK